MVLWSQNWKCSKGQDLPKFQLGGGVLWSQNWKCSKGQDLPKFQLGGVLWSQNWKHSNRQDLPKFQFGGGGVLWSQNWKYSKWQDLPKFQFWKGGGYSGVRTEIPERGSLENLDTNFAVCGYCTQTCLCITDSLSHTTYVETKKKKKTQMLIVTQTQALRERTFGSEINVPWQKWPGPPCFPPLPWWQGIPTHSCRLGWFSEPRIHQRPRAMRKYLVRCLGK